MNSTSTYLRHLRGNLTQRELASRLREHGYQVYPPEVSRLENGHTVPGIKAVAAYALALTLPGNAVLKLVLMAANQPLDPAPTYHLWWLPSTEELVVASSIGELEQLYEQYADGGREGAIHHTWGARLVSPDTVIRSCKVGNAVFMSGIDGLHCELPAGEIWIEKTAAERLADRLCHITDSIHSRIVYSHNF